MRILNRKTVEECNDLELLVRGYQKVIMDIGTGDGRFVYKMGKENPENFYIGIDASAENMWEYAAKIKKKPAKGGLSNVLYVVANAENLPEELWEKADTIHINLPWGSLLEGIVKHSDELIRSIVQIARKPAASIEMLFTYSNLHEAGEMLRRDLPELNLSYIKDTMEPAYRSAGIHFLEIETVDNNMLKQQGTQWSKRLSFGIRREIYRVKGKVETE